MEEKLALVTGASRGIGLELGTELANRGYDVVIASAGERLNGAATEIRSYGHQVIEVKHEFCAAEAPQGHFSVALKLKRLTAGRFRRLQT
jgi:short-subunit dehydrogenase